MSQSKWRDNYAHIISVIEETVPQSDPGTPFKNVRDQFTNGLEDVMGRGAARLFELYVDPDGPPTDDGSTGVARRRMRVTMNLDILYPRGSEGEALAMEDAPLVKARLRLNPGRPATSIQHIPPPIESELDYIGTDDQTGSLISRIVFDVIYLEDNTTP